MKTVQIKNRYSGAVLYEAQIPDDTPSGLEMRVALASATAARANLSDAYLSDAYLSGANLSGANLSGANLSGANLSDAYLRDAYLRDANLSGAYLSDAYLSGANLSGAKGADYAIACTRILPDGELIGWKKCKGGVIVKLRIPADAKRSHAFGRKCRAEYADVLEVIGADVAYTEALGPTTEYRAGARVIPDSWDDNWQDECSHGIHFFITRLEAENY